MEHDEIYLIDLWRIFSREWKWFVALLLLVLAGTYAFAHLSRRQWEATAWIQIGQVGQVPPGQDPKVEPLLRVIERLQLVPFENQILQSAGLSPDSPEARLYRSSLKLEPMPYAGPLIRMNIRAYSREQANLLAEATVAELHAIHQRLATIPLKSAQARLDRLQADLQVALADRARFLQEGANGTGGKDARDSVLVSMLLANKNEEIRGLQQGRDDLIDRLGPTYTYETSMMWPVYVPERQAYPNPALTWGIGILLGGFLGTLAALVRNVVRRSVGKVSGSGM